MKRTIIVLGALLVALLLAVHFVTHREPLPVEQPRDASQSAPVVDESVLDAGSATVEFNREAVRAHSPVKEVRVGGETLRVTFRRGHPPQEDDEDAAAAQLYRSVEECRSAPQSEQELAARIDAVRAGFAATGGAVAGDDGHTHSAGDSIAFWQRLYERCIGVSDELLPQALEALWLSALRGNAANALTYARAVETQQPAMARALNAALWRDGYVAALAGSGADPLAAQIVSLTLEIAGLDGRPEPLAAEWLSDARVQLAALERSVSASTYQAAEREAAQLLKNPNCCKR